MGPSKVQIFRMAHPSKQGLDFRQIGAKKLRPQPNLLALSDDDGNDTPSRLVLPLLEASVGPGGRMGGSYKPPPE
jgi:hypothetical protein